MQTTNMKSFLQVDISIFAVTAIQLKKIPKLPYSVQLWSVTGGGLVLRAA